MPKQELQGLRVVLLRALNENQLLILSKTDGRQSITSLLLGISETSSVPISTLKLNAQILKKIGLMDFNGKPASLTRLGKLVIALLS